MEILCGELEQLFMWTGGVLEGLNVRGTFTVEGAAHKVVSGGSAGSAEHRAQARRTHVQARHATVERLCKISPERVA